MDARQHGERLALLYALNLQPYKSTGVRDTSVKAALAYAEVGDNHQVRLAGRVIALRRHGRILFANLRDESGTIQLILRETEMPEDFAQVQKWLSWGMRVICQVELEPKAKT